MARRLRCIPRLRPAPRRPGASAPCPARTACTRTPETFCTSRASSTTLLISMLSIVEGPVVHPRPRPQNDQSPQVPRRVTAALRRRCRAAGARGVPGASGPGCRSRRRRISVRSRRTHRRDARTQPRSRLTSHQQQTAEAKQSHSETMKPKTDAIDSEIVALQTHTSAVLMATQGTRWAVGAHPRPAVNPDRPWKGGTQCAGRASLECSQRPTDRTAISSLDPEVRSLD